MGGLGGVGVGGCSPRVQEVASAAEKQLDRRPSCLRHVPDARRLLSGAKSRRRVHPGKFPRSDLFGLVTSERCRVSVRMLCFTAAIAPLLCFTGSPAPDG